MIWDKLEKDESEYNKGIDFKLVESFYWLNNKFFDLYKVKNKTTISKSSDSLFVFLEIIRRSYKVSASIIGSTSFLSFEKYYDDNTNTFKNSVLGNIIKFFIYYLSHICIKI